MRSIRRTLAIALMASAAAASPAAAAAVGHARVAIDSAATFPSYATTAARQDVVILQSWQADRLHALKAANPAVKVLMYQNLSAASSSVNADGTSPSGVSYATAGANGWLLTDTGTNRPFTFDGFPWLYAANVGNPRYQDAWAANVIAKLRSDAWDGVFMDDTNPTIKYHHTVSAVREYPSDAAYGAATGSMLANVGPKIQAAGKLAIGNMGAWVEYPSVVKSWLPYVSGGMDEKYLKWGYATGQGYRGQGQWTIQEQEIKDCEAAGKLFIGVMDSENSDRAAARFGYASALLAGNGHTDFSLTGDYTNETWFPEYDVNLGAPAGPETVDATGIHRRAFANGIVVVNPTGAPAAVNLGGALSGSGLSSVSSVALAPNSAVILTKDAPDPTPAPDPAPVPGPASAPAPAPAPNPPAAPASNPPAAPAPNPPAAPAPAPVVRKDGHRPRVRFVLAATTGSRVRTVQAEALGRPAHSAVLRDRGAHGGRALMLRGRSVVMRAMTKGLGILRVRARGARGARLVIRIDGHTVLTVRVSSGWRLYSVRVRPAGPHVMRVGGGGHGGLRLDELTISPV